MKVYYLCLFSLSLISICYADETKEPKAGYTLHINGEILKIEAGKEIDLKGEFKDLKLTLVPDKMKKFNFGSVEFSYPSHMSFEADINDGLKIWTLNGNEMVLMYYQFPNLKMSAKDLAESIASQYGEETVVVPIEMKLNGVKYKCSKLNITLAGIKLHQTICSLPSKQGSQLFIIQDNYREEGENKDKNVEVMKLLNTTFNVK